MSMLFLALNATAADKLTSHVNPFMGTATLWEPADLGYTRTETKRAWGAEVFPGATLPNAMVQLTLIVSSLTVRISILIKIVENLRR